MSAEVLAVSALCGLAVAAAAVVLPALPSANRRVQQMRVARERREAEAREVVVASSASRFEEELAAHSMPAAPNWHSGEHRVVPADEAQVWATQERLPEVLDEQPEVPHWQRPALADEPTPLAPGPVPTLPDDLDPSTVGWNRAELLERIRRAELALAKAKSDPADEELAA